MMGDMDIKALFPGWETVRKIGTGSFGTVYEIQRDLFGKKERAALKRISIPQNESDIDDLYGNGFDDASITAHFQNYLADIVSEYSLMAEMKGHTNVVYCDDIRYIQHDDGFGWDIYIKMELLTPMMKTLGKEVTDEQVIKLGRDLCKALVLCRSRNIIHRDIKPQNIFISDDGDYKLGDFGIAKTVEKTSGGTKIGTYNYMAPEVYNNEPYGHGADIYSLGLVMYWLLNERRMPFNPLPPAVPTASEMEGARLRRFQGEPLPAPAHGSGELKQIVLKACAYDPRDRYQSAAEMLTALECIGKADVQEFIPVPAGDDGEAEDTCILENIAEEGTSLLQEDDSPEREEQTVLLREKDAPKPEEDKTANVHTAEKKPKKKTFLWIIAACLVLAAVAVMIGKSMKIVDISAGTYNVLGLRANGTVVAISGEINAELYNWKNIAAVSAGHNQTVCLKSDGTVVAVGNNEYGQCNVSGWRDIVAISSGRFHIVGLKSDGTVVAAGDNSFGQCDVSGWKDIVAISAGHNQTVGLKSDGTVVATGNNEYGQCDVSDWRGIVAISAGDYHTVGLKADGTVVAVGMNKSKQCNVSGWKDIVAISAGGYHTVGLKSDGTVIAVGYNKFGQCDVSDWGDIVAISAGGYLTVGLKSNGRAIVVGK